MQKSAHGVQQAWVGPRRQEEPAVLGPVQVEPHRVVELVVGVDREQYRANPDAPADINGDDPWQPPDEPPPNESPPDDRTPVYADQILTRSALHNLPNPEPLIDNVLDQGTTALLYGRWGTAKSFIALDWGLSVVTGRNWQGRTTQQRRTLYIAGEGAFGFKGRIDAWETGWHTSIGDDDFAILPHPVNLMRPLEVNNLAALIDWGGYTSSSSTPWPAAWSALTKTRRRTPASSWTRWSNCWAVPPPAAAS